MFEEVLSSHDQSFVGAASINPEPAPHDCQSSSPLTQSFDMEHERITDTVVAGRSRSLPHSGKGTPRRLPGRNDRSTAIKQNIKLMQDLNQVLFQQHTGLNRQRKQQQLAVDAGLVLNDSSVNDSFNGGLSPQIFNQASTRRSSTPLRAKVSDSDFVTGGKDLFGRRDR